MSVLLLPFLALSDQEDWTGARSATCCSCVFLLRFPSSDCVSVCNRDKHDYPAWLERYGEPEIVTTADHAAQVRSTRLPCLPQDYDPWKHRLIVVAVGAAKRAAAGHKQAGLGLALMHHAIARGHRFVRMPFAALSLVLVMFDKRSLCLEHAMRKPLLSTQLVVDECRSTPMSTSQMTVKIQAVADTQTNSHLYVSVSSQPQE